VTHVTTIPPVTTIPLLIWYCYNCHALLTFFQGVIVAVTTGKKGGMGYGCFQHFFAILFQPGIFYPVSGYHSLYIVHFVLHAIWQVQVRTPLHLLFRFLSWVCVVWILLCEYSGKYHLGTFALRYCRFYHGCFFVVSLFQEN